MGMSDRVRAMEGKGMSEKKRVASMEGKGVSEKERVVSMEGKGLSEKERVSSMEGKGVSEKERVVSMEGKGVSEKERVVSMEANGEGKGLSEKERVVSMEGNGKVEPPPPFQIEQQEEEKLSPAGSNNLKKILMVTSLAAGVQFGWALQLSLLTPYVQLLGIPHKWAGYIWLCGPITGIIVQPLVGYYSDRCTSRFGRRRPFIAAGTLLIAIAVFLIGFAADLGHSFGDDEKKKSKPRAIAVFVVGFWIYDVANNMLGAPCRALLADLSGNSQKKTRTANMIFAFFMAVGNVLGYAAGSFRKLYKVFPFTKTEACDIYCANLKSCFIIHIFLLLTLTALLFIIVTEIPWSKPAPSNAGNKDEKKSMSIVTVFRELKRPMWILLLVTALNYIAWCPFFLYDTDWMGREVYGGKVGEGRMYDIGVHAGSLGLMLNSVVIGCMSLAGEFIARRVGGVKRLWGGANFLLAVCLGLTVLITKLADSSRRFSDAARTDPLPPPTGVKAGALTIFAVLGIPQAVVYTVPFALASIFSNDAGAGQGVSLGVLNLAIVIPQLIVSVTAGPWDELFGGGNLPAFIVGAISAAVSGVLALTILPSPSPEQTATKTNGIPHH